jgi:hypothetical protein
MRNYILCAGVPYEFSGEPFREYARNRIAKLSDTLPRNEAARFLVLDFRSGSTSTTEVAWESGKRKEVTKTVVTHAPITKSNYKVVGEGSEKYHFKRDQDGRFMSVLDIYRAISAIGLREAGTLEEVSVFSHAYVEGPILVNSDDLYSALRPDLPDAKRLRDPQDYDARAAKDFTRANMTIGQLRLFQRAFSPRGFVWIWGCTSADAVRKVIGALIATKPNAQRGDKVALRLSAEEVAALSVFANFVTLDFALVRKTGRCTIDVSQLLEGIVAQIEGCYAMSMARATGVLVISALPGTYAEFENERLGGLMKITAKRGVQISFHQKYFGFELDREGRRYGLFKSDMNLGNDD